MNFFDFFKSPIFSAVLIVLILIPSLALIIPIYKVWAKGLAGEASLREAEFSKQNIIQEAKANAEAAILLAEAEVNRAKGVAEANAIIADGLGGADGYLRYLYIEGLKMNKQNQIIYVPTEAQLPVLEAGRLGK